MEQNQSLPEVFGDPITSRAIYANFFSSTNTQHIFAFHFILADIKSMLLVGKFVVPPMLAKQISETLSRQVKAYEVKFGPIENIEY